jgi:hypothetical protein
VVVEGKWVGEVGEDNKGSVQTGTGDILMVPTFAARRVVVLKATECVVERNTAGVR